MLFTAWQFILVFLPVTLAVFFAIPVQRRTLRKLWLCGASLFFYGYWKIEYVPLLLISLGFNFIVAEILTHQRGSRVAARTLAAGVTVNLLLLGYFKYTNFLAGIFGKVFHQEVGRFDIILPLAISFFTFTQIGYLVDVSRDPNRHCQFLDYALFVVFFPHLIAGPIIRHWEIIPQYATRDLQANRTDLGVGLALFLLGLYKKVLLANPAGVYADTIYDVAAAGTTLTCFDAWLGTLAYALQIYFDFSGYSDMAIGLARMFSIKFPINFDSPYRAGNVAQFWRRWHVTLTRFLREYVYFALGGNRRGEARRAANVLIMFLLSGLWHGAGWTFILWGLLHGFYLVVHRQWQRLLAWRGWHLTHWSYRGACVLLTFVAVLFSWVFFRAPNVATAHHVIASMSGWEGLTFPKTAFSKKDLVGRFLDRLGARFVRQTVPIESYWPAMISLCGLLGIAWFCPNTQQLLRAYEPVLETDLRPARWRLVLHPGLGVILATPLLLVARTYYSAAPSPFLYFNF